MIIYFIIRNKVTRSESMISADLWNAKKNTKEWYNVFEVIKTIEEPPEVIALKTRLSEKK